MSYLLQHLMKNGKCCDQQPIFRCKYSLLIEMTDMWDLLNILSLCRSRPLIAEFMGPTWGPSGADRTQVGPMLAPWTLLSGTPQSVLRKGSLWNSTQNILCIHWKIHVWILYNLYRVESLRALRLKSSQVFLKHPLVNCCIFFHYLKPFMLLINKVPAKTLHCICNAFSYWPRLLM